MLEGKLKEAVVLIDGIIGKKRLDNASVNVLVRKQGELKKAKFVLQVKKCLNETIAELEKWHTMFDPSWYLMMSAKNPTIDEHLDKAREDRAETQQIVAMTKGLRDVLNDDSEIKQKMHVFLSAEQLNNGIRDAIEYSTAQVFQRHGSASRTVLDPVTCDRGESIPLLTKHVRELAKKLTKADPFTFGLMKCRGVVKLTSHEGHLSGFNFVFNVPDTLSDPISLRGMLLRGQYNGLLNGRFDIAKQLARSIMYIHSFQFVHKNIRPETILIFRNSSTNSEAPFLLGFEKFRPAEAATSYLGDAAWETNLYRHPSRQGLHPEDSYRMQHDIYSLGVCLLEIGLWGSFVQYNKPGGEPSAAPIFDIIDTTNSGKEQKASAIKERLLEMATQSLPGKMGAMYTSIVVNCLTCLDDENDDFGDESEFLDEDGILIGVKYIQKVHLALRLLIHCC